jgi:hypothetical protein
LFGGDGLRPKCTDAAGGQAASSETSSGGATENALVSSGWYRLLDLCGLTDTLIGDADHNKAAGGELRRGLPVGFVWGEEDGEVHPDCTAICTVFDRFDELGSVRRGWLWLRSESIGFPLQAHYGSSIRWVAPS